MADHTHFRCMSCNEIQPLNARENNVWTGWTYVDGKMKLVPINNYCCPLCGSNDLIFRAPGVDAVAA